MPARFHGAVRARSQCHRARILGWLLRAALMVGALLAVSPVRASRESCLSAHEQAQLMRLRGRFLEARAQLLVCAQSSCPALVSNDCVAWLEEVEASLPSVVFAVVDDRGQDLVDVRVSANGKPWLERVDGRAVPLDPAVVELTFEAPGHATVRQTITVREGQKQRLIRVELRRAGGGETDAAETAPAARFIASYVLGGGALGALATGVTLGALGKSELDRLKRKCPEVGCSQAERQHGKRLYIAADVMFGLSAGLAVTASWLFFSARKSGRPPERRSALIRFQPQLTPSAFSVRYQAVF